MDRELGRRSKHPQGREKRNRSNIIKEEVIHVNQQIKIGLNMIPEM